MNADVESYSGVQKFVDDFNKNNKQEYFIIFQTNSTDPSTYSADVFKNKKFVETVPYQKKTNEE